MKHDEPFDSILDQALSEYRDAEPLAGIEERVLRRLRQKPQSAAAHWLKWAALAACAVTLVVAGWLMEHRRPSPSHEAQKEARPRIDATAPVPASAERQPQHPRSGSLLTAGSRPSDSRRRAIFHSGDPKPERTAVTARAERAPGSWNLDQVAGAHAQSSVPLTREEQAFILVAQTNPNALRGMTTEGQLIGMAPLTIQPMPSLANPEGEQ